MTTNFYECIHRQLLKGLTHTCIVWPAPDGAGRAYSGRAVLDRIAEIGFRLSQRGLRSGQPVMLAMPVTFDLICTLLAVMAQGAIPVLPPTAANPRSLLALVRQGGVRLVITRREPSGLLAWLARQLGVSVVATNTIQALPLPWLRPALVDPNQPALVSHSSGSTGRAKSIRRSHAVLRAQHEALRDAFPPWPGQRDFPLFPNVLLHNLATGTVSILPDLPGFSLARMQPDRLIQQLLHEEVQTLTGNVYYFQKLLPYLALHPGAFADVRAVGIGGSPVPEWLVQALKNVFVQATIYIIYGSSEAEPIAIRAVGDEPEDARFGYAVGTILPSLRVDICPMGTLTLPNGIICATGEIRVRGAHVAQTGNGWLATGDYGYIDPLGQLFLTGRQGNEQIHRGVQHYQIEHVLQQVNGVVRVAARATATGFTVYTEGRAAEADLRAALDQNFPGGLVDGFKWRKKLPVDARHHSKIRYEKLT